MTDQPSTDRTQELQPTRRPYEAPAVTGTVALADVVQKSGIGGDQAWPHPVKN